MSQVAPVGSETQFFCRAECTDAALFGFRSAGALFGSAPFPASLRMGPKKNEVGKVASGDQPGGWVVQPDELGRAPRYVRTYVRIATRRSFPSRGGYVRTYVRRAFPIHLFDPGKNTRAFFPPRGGESVTQPCSPNVRERSANAEVSEVDHPKLSGEERRRPGHRCEPPVSDL